MQKAKIKIVVLSILKILGKRKIGFLRGQAFFHQKLYEKRIRETFPWGNFPRGNSPRWNLMRGDFPRENFTRGVFRGGIYRGGVLRTPKITCAQYSFYTEDYL